jgi:hypothetical protein
MKKWNTGSSSGPILEEIIQISIPVLVLEIRPGLEFGSGTGTGFDSSS